MKIQTAKRMESFQPGIFNVLDQRKNQLLAQGRQVYNLSIGTPDFLPAPHVVEALAKAASDPKNYRYSLGETPELVEAVQSWYRLHSPLTLLLCCKLRRFRLPSQPHSSGPSRHPLLPRSTHHLRQTR